MDTENHTKHKKIKPPTFQNPTPTTTIRTSSSRKPLSDCTNNLTPLPLSKSKPPLPPKDLKTSTPPQNPNSVSGPKDLEVSKPCTVSRRHAAEKRKSKGKDPAVFRTAFPVKRNRVARGMSIEERDGAISKSCPVPNKKKRPCVLSKEESSSRALQDYVRQQQSYFAEIDAFELLEEEVASAEDLE